MIRYLNIFLFVIGAIMGKGELQTQRFRVEPKDVRAKEGEEIVLPCEVENRAGEVQWTKDGMALGYERIIPGHPRYSMIGDESRGVYNLKIENVTLNDDAVFECQVSPVIKPYKHSSLRATAKVNVTSPPSSLEMFDHVNNSKVVVRMEQELKLHCLAKNSRPPAKVLWYRGKNELKLDHSEIVKDCRKRNGSNVEECDVLSTIVLKPKLADDSTQISCVAKHEALPGKMSLFSTVQMSVLYPPDPPFIDGYIEGKDLIDGEEIELTCKSSGGNPLAQLVWFKNKQSLNKNTYSAKGKISESNLKFVVKPEDNEANYTCEASNRATEIPLNSSVKLSVLFGPNQVTLTGADEGKAGETVTVTCITSSSNPPAHIQWVVDGHESTGSEISYSSGANGGKVTTSTLEITVPSQKEEITVYCYGSNPRTPKNAISNRTIHIHYPPGQPLISGFVKNGFIISDTPLSLGCTSAGGNPLATLTWYKNNKKFSGGTKRTDRTTAYADIQIIANKDDNGAIYKCEAINPTIDVPLVANITLNVYFPPDDVLISVKPTELHAGMQVILFCNATVSNPEADITWWLEGLPIPRDSSTISSQPGLYGGKLTFSELILDITPEMNGNKVTCQAANNVWKQSKSIFTTLNVKYKPKFLDSNYSSTIYSVEGEYFSKTFNAIGNPSDITYRWKKDGVSLNNQHTSTLTIRKLKRSDAGFYTCQASNSEGLSDLITFPLAVKYEASIANMSKNVIVSNGSNAEMFCVLDGNPIESYHVTWMNPNIPDLLDRSQMIFENNTLILKLTGVTHRDAGLFYCVANNTIGSAVNESSRLIIEHSPVTNMNPSVYKIASNVNGTVEFVCKGSGVPELFFAWAKNGTKGNNIKESSKYSMTKRQTDLLNYKSILTIQHITSSDYGTYVCTVKNTLGESKVYFELLIKSIPDMPINLQLVNVTHNTVTLSWTLEFNGGEPAIFVVRYYAENYDNRKYHQVEIDSDTIYTVSGLQHGVTYVFDVAARNRIGQSSFSLTKINATTIMPSGSKLIVEIPVYEGGLILLIVAGVGILLISLNVLFVLICIWKRSRKTKKAGRSSNDMSSQIETVSSLQSEKSVRFSTSDDNRNINEDLMNTPYIIEDINYPFIENNDYELQRRHSAKDILSQKLYGNAYEGYSTIGHGHHLKPMVPQLIPYSVNSTLNFAQSTLPNIGKRKYSNAHNGGYYRDISPTPTIPPPMSKSLLSDNFLNL